MRESEYYHRIGAAVSPLLPDGVMLRASSARVGIEIVAPPGVQLHGFTGMGWRDRDEHGDPELSADELEDMGLEILNLVQDVLCETYREPWPNRGVAAVPPPGIEVTDEAVRMWFGDQGIRFSGSRRFRSTRPNAGSWGWLRHR